MIRSWRFLNGERIWFPSNSKDARDLGWHRVEHNANVSIHDWFALENWLKDHVLDRAYWLDEMFVYFYRESDATMFTLKWV